MMNEREIKEELKQLHFEKAYQGLEDSTLQDPLLYSYCLRGLYRLVEALAYARLAYGPKGRIEEIKCLFALGQVEEAKTMAQERYELDPSDDLCMVYASLCGEIGEVEHALALLKEVEKETLDDPSKVEYEILLADLYSFQEKNEMAIAHYEQALKEADGSIPKNWRALRKMLIHHNMADLYEQMEEETLAIHQYANAKAWMDQQKQTDPSVTDLSSYEIELLLSSANCLANAEKFERAHTDLTAAKRLYEQKPPFQKEYVHARIAYITGLISMNEGDEDKAYSSFKEACTVQEKLVALGLDKQEHLARTAYYLASLSNDEEEKKRLYDVAGPIFVSVIEKEPTFYLSSLGEIENERGQMEIGDKALHHYDRAIEWYSMLLDTHPEDLLAQESLLVCRLNRLRIKDDQLGVIQDAMEQIKMVDPAFLIAIRPYLESLELASDIHSWIEAFYAHLPSYFLA